MTLIERMAEILRTTPAEVVTAEALESIKRLRDVVVAWPPDPNGPGDPMYDVVWIMAALALGPFNGDGAKVHTVTVSDAVELTEKAG